MTPLRVLRVEDGSGDPQWVQHVLRQGDFEVHTHGVRTAGELHAALTREPWDVILSDDRPREFDLATVLGIVRDRGLDIPLIVVSRSSGEGVEEMKAGARDFFSSPRLSRLPAAVAREVEAARVRSARRQAERDRALLSRAGELLARSLDFQETVERVARLVVPELADWCAVYLPEEGRVLKLVALAHEDPAMVAHGFALDQRFPLDPDAAVGPARAWRDGEPQLVQDVSGSRLEALARSPEHLDLLRQGAVRSIIHMPLLGRTRCLGVMTLGGSGHRPAFTPTDLTLCRELAHRAALALENAHLLRESQEAIRLRDEFLAVAAHELRTPLTTLGLQLGTLVQRARRESSSGLVERLERGLRQVRRLGTLVEALLDVSRLSSGELSLSRERVDLGALVGEVLERFEVDARSVGCALRLDVAPGLIGQWDRMRVEQVVSSLVANALKFGPRQPVEVWGGAVGAVARVVVEDRGIGLPPDRLERIFERFGRAVSHHSYGGLGLGLYLSRRVVEAHGGRVWAEQRPGGGARFTLELPLERA